MGLSARERAQDDLDDFDRQFGEHRTLLEDGGHIAAVQTHRDNAQAAFDEHRYRQVWPRLQLARGLIEHVVKVPVAAKPQNQLTVGRQLQRLWAKCFRKRPGLRISLALGVVFAAMLIAQVGPNLHHAITVHNARDAVTNALENGGYASQSQVTTAAELPPGYRFYVGPQADIQKLLPGQMAWTSLQSIEGLPGNYGIPPGNDGIGSNDSRNQNGVTVNNNNDDGSSDASAVLVVNTGKGGFIAVGFICNGDEPSDGSAFQSGDTPVQITSVSMNCSSD